MDILGLAHVGLFVADIERTVEFYESILEFRKIFEFSVNEADGTVTRAAFIENNGFVIELISPENCPIRADGHFDHIAFKVSCIEDVKQRLIKKGIGFETESVVYNSDCFENGSAWILFRGPDGEHLELNERF